MNNEQLKLWQDIDHRATSLPLPVLYVTKTICAVHPGSEEWTREVLLKAQRLQWQQQLQQHVRK